MDGKLFYSCMLCIGPESMVGQCYTRTFFTSNPFPSINSIPVPRLAVNRPVFRNPSLDRNIKLGIAVGEGLRTGPGTATNNRKRLLCRNKNTSYNTINDLLAPNRDIIVLGPIHLILRNDATAVFARCRGPYPTTEAYPITALPGLFVSCAHEI